VPYFNDINGVDWQTGLSARLDCKGVFPTVANPDGGRSNTAIKGRQSGHSRFRNRPVHPLRGSRCVGARM